MKDKWMLNIVLLVATIFLLTFNSTFASASTSTTAKHADSIQEITQTEMQIQSAIYRGKIMDIKETTPGNQDMTIRILRGPFKGEIINTQFNITGNPAKDFYYKKGERVLLWIESQDGEIVRSYVREVTRDNYLAYLALFFIFSLVLIGGKKGIKTVISLGITGVLIVYVLIPLILEGYSPVVSTVVVASIIVTSSVFIISGFNRKTYSAILGTIGGVVLAAILAWIMTKATRLTGLSGDESQMLMYIPQQVNFDFQGLLFAGMIIGAIGAVLDVGVSIASAIDEVKQNNPSITTKNLIKSGMNMGKDIMGTMANTLILAYTGASMSLLLVLVAYDIPFVRIVNMDAMSTEIIRVLAGSIGLIYAIPITAIIAGFMYNYKKETDV